MKRRNCLVLISCFLQRACTHKQKHTQTHTNTHTHTQTHKHTHTCTQGGGVQIHRQAQKEMKTAVHAKRSTSNPKCRFSRPCRHCSTFPTRVDLHVFRSNLLILLTLHHWLLLLPFFRSPSLHGGCSGTQKFIKTACGSNIRRTREA